VCDQCSDELDALLESLHERHEVGERLDVLRELHTSLREAIVQAREDISDDEVASGPEDDDAELFDDDEEEDE